MVLHQRYIWRLLVIALLILAGVATFNIVLDPFGVYSEISYNGFVPYRNYRFRTPKAEIALRKNWETVILGSSRSEVGIDPEHPAWGDGLTCNASLSGTNFYELSCAFNLALRSTNLRRIALFLDPELFACPHVKKYDFAKSKFNPEWSAFEYHFANLLGIDASTESAKVAVRAYRKTLSSVTPLGSDRPRPEHVNYREFIGASLERFFRSYPNNGKYTVNMTKGNALFREMVRTSYSRGIELIVVIPPDHAIQLEARRLSGLLPTLESLKRDMLDVLSQEARRANSKPFPLWDFSGFSGYVAETIPLDENPSSQMKWHLENVHFTRDLGDIIICRILGREDICDGQLDSFGVLLTKHNLDTHSARIRKEREVYAATNPEEIQFVRQFADEIIGNTAHPQ